MKKRYQIRNTMLFRNKRILTLGVILSTLCGLTSCKKNLLDTVPKTKVLSSNMWMTDNLTDQGVNGVYANLRNGQMLYVYDSYVGLEGRSISFLMNGTATTSSSSFSSEWENLYEGVHRANNAIYGISSFSPSEETKKARLIGEVKFLRAFYYYRLNQLWKGVPIYLEPIEWDGTNLPRNTESEVWDQVIQDLSDCINEINVPDRLVKGDANYGRVTHSAAYALRGKVYMYLNEWQKAIADFQKVKDLGHNLFGDYKTLFKDENEQSPEMIFSIQNIPLSGYGNDFQFTFGSRSAFGSDWNTYLVHPDAVDRYQNIDGTDFNWDDVLPGYNQMSVSKREVFFLRNNLTATEIANMTKKGVDMSLYLPAGNEERLRKAYENRDPRLDINVILPYATFVGNNNGVDQIFTMRWPYRQEFGGVFDLRTDITSRFHYLPRKFVYEGANPIIPDRSSGGYDYPVIRYADILLLWAEAMNELGKTADALGLMNEVRNRAGVKAVTGVSDQVIVRNIIRDERRRELLGEGVLFFDEMRWKTFKDISFYEGNGIKQVWGSVVTPYLWLGDELYTWPIPQVERERNLSLTQNNGWTD